MGKSGSAPGRSRLGCQIVDANGRLTTAPRAGVPFLTMLAAPSLERRWSPRPNIVKGGTLGRNVERRARRSDSRLADRVAQPTGGTRGEHLGARAPRDSADRTHRGTRDAQRAARLQEGAVQRPATSDGWVVEDAVDVGDEEEDEDEDEDEEWAAGGSSVSSERPSLGRSPSRPAPLSSDSGRRTRETAR